MTKQQLVQAVMFADVSGSSKLYKSLGNDLAKQHIDKTLEALQAITRECGGHVVKTIGDEIMARFSAAEPACNAAIAMQQLTVQTTQSGSLSIRIGLSYGNTIMDKEGDIFGDTVNDAADVAHIARAKQVVVTDGLANALSGDLKNCCQQFDHIKLKGGDTERVIYRLQWETPTLSQNETIVMSVRHIDAITSKNCLWLSCYGHQYTLTPENLPFTIGRDTNNVDLYVNNTRASREHCIISYHRGKYVVSDHSTNGTYICVEGSNRDLYIRREAAQLHGSGYIGTGISPSDSRENSVHFKINQKDIK